MGGWQPYQVSRQRLSRPRKCRGTSGHPAGHFSRQIRVSACSGAGKGERGGFWASAGKVVELHLYKEARAGLPAAAGKLESWRGPGPCTEAT